MHAACTLIPAVLVHVTANGTTTCLCRGYECPGDRLSFRLWSCWPFSFVVVAIIMNFRLSALALVVLGAVCVSAAVGKLTKLETEVLHAAEDCEVKAKNGDRVDVHYTGRLRESAFACCLRRHHGADASRRVGWSIDSRGCAAGRRQEIRFES